MWDQETLLKIKIIWKWKHSVSQTMSHSAANIETNVSLWEIPDCSLHGEKKAK